MNHSGDVLPHADRMGCCQLTQRARTAMDSVCDLVTTSQPHFVFCFKPSKVKPMVQVLSINVMPWIFLGQERDI